MEEISYLIMNQILGMKWLNDIIHSLFILIGMDPSSLFVNSLQFFLFDTIKIFILLSILIFFVSYLQSYFSPERS
ncbi:MAG: permease, partial [Erysipelotrichaceae bacterium]